MLVFSIRQREWELVNTWRGGMTTRAHALLLATSGHHQILCSLNARCTRVPSREITVVEVAQL